MASESGRRSAGACLTLATLLLSPAAAFAATAIDPDLLTVSGRAALPSGDGTSLSARLEIGAVTLDPGVAAAIDVKPEALQTALSLAAAKTLRNYGYRWTAPVSGPAGAATTMDIEVEPFDVTPDPSGEKVTAHLRLAAGGATACFPYEATGEFHALTALRSGGNQKALAIFIVIASAAAGVNAAPLMVDQFRSADEQQAALNSKRVVGKAEGVAPQGGPQVVVRYGAINALQLALASLIAHLGEPGGCNAAVATPAVITQTTPAPSGVLESAAQPPPPAAGAASQATGAPIAQTASTSPGAATTSVASHP
jgi:hypothetical protein